MGRRRGGRGEGRSGRIGKRGVEGAEEGEGNRERERVKDSDHSCESHLARTLSFVILLRVFVALCLFRRIARPDYCYCCNLFINLCLHYCYCYC